MKKTVTGLCFFLGLLVVLVSVMAAVPKLINYQGILTDEGGAPVTGLHDLTFTIYPDSTGGAPAYWTETHAGVEIDDGLFSVVLGGVVAVPETLFVGNERWIGIRVDADPEMTPRLRLTSVPWALRAGVADTALALGNLPSHSHHALDAADGSPANALYINEDGKVGIGTTTPTSNLMIWGPYATLHIQGHDGSGCYFTMDNESSTIHWTLGHRLHANYLELYGWNSQTLEEWPTLFFGGGGYLGVGKAWPSYRLDVAGWIQAEGLRVPYNAGEGYVLTSDGEGMGRWAPAQSGMGGSGTANYVAKFTGATSIGNSIVYDTGDKVGIGTTAPAASLHAVNSGPGPAGIFQMQNALNDTTALFATTLGGASRPALSGVGPSGYYGYIGGSTRGAYGRSPGSNFGYLGGNDYGAYGRCGPNYGYLGGGGAGAYGATAAGTYGYLGGDRAVYGYHLTGNVGYLGGANYGVFGQQVVGPGNYAGCFVGNVHVNGTLTASNKQAVVQFPDGSYRGLHCQESPEVWFEDFGAGRLVRGRAYVELDPLFLETVTVSEEHPMRVFVQLTSGDPVPIVVRKQTTGFEVVCSDPSSDATFDYRIAAKRKGFEDLRLEPVDVAGEKVSVK